jgi:hypothetical protein
MGAADGRDRQALNGAVNQKNRRRTSWAKTRGRISRFKILDYFERLSNEGLEPRREVEFVAFPPAKNARVSKRVQMVDFKGPSQGSRDQRTDVRGQFLTQKSLK